MRTALPVNIPVPITPQQSSQTTPETLCSAPPLPLQSHTLHLSHHTLPEIPLSHLRKSDSRL